MYYILMPGGKGNEKHYGEKVGCQPYRIWYSLDFGYLKRFSLKVASLNGFLGYTYG